MDERTRFIITNRTPSGRCQTCGGFCDRQGMLTPGPVQMCPWCVSRLDAFIAAKERERDFWATVVAGRILSLACCVAAVVYVAWSFIAG